MAGHSKFKNIMHRKGAQDKKRAKLFSRLIREISVATKLGLPDPAMNPRLRSAINNALSANMPKENIDKAIKKQTDSNSNDQIEEIVYEGYGPNGIAVIIECFTDNKNRTASELRSILSKNNGNLGISGCVRHFFEKVAIIVLPNNLSTFEEIFEFVIPFGVEDIEESEKSYEIIMKPDSFHHVFEKLENKYKIPLSSSLEWRANELVNFDEFKNQKILDFFDKLEDLDDVQNIFSNFNFK